jgi:TetR/AcrR family transcriptional regulator, regulator of cefoperazone and chloramphenicol sensitivity
MKHTIVLNIRLIYTVVCAEEVPVQPKPDDTRSRLIDAAGEIFAEKGFEPASVREICARAEANLAAINYHFGDKEGLYTEVVRAASCASSEENDFRWPPGTPPEDKLRDVIRSRLSALLSPNLPRWADHIMVRAMAEPTKATENFIVQSLRPKFQLMEQVLSELVPPGTSTSDLHLAAMSVIAQCLHFRIQATITRLIVGEEEYRNFTVERLADHVTRFSLAGLGHGSFLRESLVHGAAT